MRIALLADIHANLEALQAVLGDMDAAGAQAAWCLGDIVGYGADPGPCITLVRGRGMLCLKGNHDRVASGGPGIESFNSLARAAVTWTAGRLDEAERAWLAALPTRAVPDPRIVLVHGALSGKDRYLSTGEAAAAELPLLAAQYPQARILACGHTHQARLTGDDGRMDRPPDGETGLDPARRWVLNPGAVGQPRDRDPRAGWALLDLDRMTVAWRRVPYDVERAMQKIRDVGLPYQLATRLAEGQ